MHWTNYTYFTDYQESIVNWKVKEIQVASQTRYHFERWQSSLLLYSSPQRLKHGHILSHFVLDSEILQDI